MTQRSDAASRRTAATTLRDLSWTVHRRVPEVRDFHPLPATELGVLKHVLDSPGVTVTELSRRLGLRSSNTSAAVRTLLGRGLLARRPDPSDRRVTQLVPTEEALREDDSIATAWSGAIQTALARLDAKHLAALVEAIPALEALDHLIRDEQGSP